MSQAQGLIRLSLGLLLIAPWASAADPVDPVLAAIAAQRRLEQLPGIVVSGTVSRPQAGVDAGLYERKFELRVRGTTWRYRSEPANEIPAAIQQRLAKPTDARDNILASMLQLRMGGSDTNGLVWWLDPFAHIIQVRSIHATGWDVRPFEDVATPLLPWSWLAWPVGKGLARNDCLTWHHLACTAEITAHLGQIKDRKAVGETYVLNIPFDDQVAPGAALPAVTGTLTVTLAKESGAWCVRSWHEVGAPKSSSPERTFTFGYTWMDTPAGPAPVLARVDMQRTGLPAPVRTVVATGKATPLADVDVSIDASAAASITDIDTGMRIVP